MNSTRADLILVNGRVFTVDPSLVWAQAVACSAGRILAVGSNEQIVALAGGPDQTEVIDVNGRLVLPGFTDAHVHFLAYAQRRQEIPLVGVRSLDEVRRRVRHGVERTPHGEWVLGWGWDESHWDMMPHATLLDEVAPDTPVVLKRVDMHTWWVNSAALRLAGITRDTPEPAIGRIERDASGEPVGLLREWGAIELIESRLPQPNAALLDGWLLDAVAEAHRFGITGIHDQRVKREGSVSLRAFQRLRESGRLALRVHFNVASEFLPLARELGLQSGFGDDHLWLGHMKLFADGSMGSSTALMLDAYEGQLHNRGLAVTPADEVAAMVAECEAAGFRVAVHAIGDRAVREVLDAFGRALQCARQGSPGVGMPHRIEHVQLVHPADVPRLAQFGIAASMQPVHLSMDWHVADRVWGGRARNAYALRSLQDCGTQIAFGSDVPVAPFDPMVGIYAAVTRQDEAGNPPGGWYPEECVTVADAIRGYTLGPASVAGKDSVSGSLTPGKWADLVVISPDILTIDPAATLEAEVFLTVFDGRVVYRRE